MDALALMRAALGLWQRVHPGESLDQMCQRFSGYYVQWAYQGNENIRVYGSAKAAALASKMESGGINSAPVGSFIYWSIGKDWHIGNVIGHDNGRALVCYATRGGDTVLALSHGVKVSHADTYSPSTFYGWSWTNGTNPRMQGITAWGMAPARPLDDVRRVAVYLNGRNLGKTSSAVIDGVPGANLYWMIQKAGTIDRVYNGEIDGKTGPRTEAAFDHYIRATIPKPPAEPEPEPPAEPSPPIEPEPEEPPVEPEPEPPIEPEPEPEDPTEEPPVELPETPPINEEPSKPKAGLSILGIVGAIVAAIVALILSVR